MKRLRLFVIFAAVIEVAIQIIGGAAVIGADDALQPLITTSELIVGQNRFAFGLAKQGNNAVYFLSSAPVWQCKI